jgi:tRNA G46 methylase TrmB
MVEAQLAVMNGRRLNGAPDLTSRQGGDGKVTTLEIGLGVGAVHPDRAKGMKELQVIGKSEVFITSFQSLLNPPG